VSSTAILALQKRQLEDRRRNLAHPVRSRRIDVLADTVERWPFGFDNAFRAADDEGKAILDAFLVRAIDSILALDDELFALTTKPVREWLKPDDEMAVIVATIVAIAQAKGAVRAKVDVLYALAIENSAAAHREHIVQLSGPKLSGWLQRHDVQEVLVGLGIVTWFVEKDRQHRLVNTRRLVAHADMRRFIAGRYEGARCRLCQLTESDEGSVHLVPAVRSERTSGMAQDAAGRRLHAAASGGLVHTQCAPYWDDWVRDASRYASDAEAEDADRVAGRASVPAPPLPHEPEAAPEEGVASEAAGYGPRDYYGSSPTPSMPMEARRSASEIYDVKLARRRARRNGDGN
jgi:hypothetical protein